MLPTHTRGGVPPAAEQGMKPEDTISSYVDLMTNSLASLPPLSPREAQFERNEELQDEDAPLSPPRGASPFRATHKQVVSNDDDV